MPNKYGFIPSVIVEEEHYVLGDGCLPTNVKMPDGHGWGAYLPVSEVQERNGLETENCTNYGTLHALATLGKKNFGAQFQTALSERYTGVETGTGQNGNDPHNVIEIIRTKCGVIPEAFLPFDDSIKTWSQYYSPNPMQLNLWQVGQSWLRKYKVGHQWVFVVSDNQAARQAKMKEALKYSPLAASGFAWAQRESSGLYWSAGNQNHWFVVYDYVDGVKWLVFDSYDNTRKELEWDYQFGQCKSYTLDLNISGMAPSDETSTNWFSDLLVNILAFFKDLIINKK